MPPPTFGGGRTYLDAIAGTKSKSVVIPSADKNDLEWLERCVVGEVKDMETLNEINHLLREGCFSQCAAKYIGGFQVLLECSSVECLRRLLEEGHVALKEWFKWVSPWSRPMEEKRVG